jgi:hypothetical protein
MADNDKGYLTSENSYIIENAIEDDFQVCVNMINYVILFHRQIGLSSLSVGLHEKNRIKFSIDLFYHFITDIHRT